LKETEMAVGGRPGSLFGFVLGGVHLFDPDPEGGRNRKLVEYGRESDGRPVMTGPRVNAAVRSYDKNAPAEKAQDGHHGRDAKKRPEAEDEDVMHWWVGNHLGWGAPGAPPDRTAQLGSDQTIDANLRRYRKDLDALVEHVDKAKKGTGRPYRLVGKANHDWHTFKPDGVEHRFLSAMASHIKRAIESKKHHFFNCRPRTEKAKSDKKGEKADNSHTNRGGEASTKTLAVQGPGTRTGPPQRKRAREPPTGNLANPSRKKEGRPASVHRRKTETERAPGSRR
jgi:hypothetical protein